MLLLAAPMAEGVHRAAEALVHRGCTDPETGALMNVHPKNCWGAHKCGGQQGPCAFCGTGGVCCRKNSALCRAEYTGSDRFQVIGGVTIDKCDGSHVGTTVAGSSEWTQADQGNGCDGVIGGWLNHGCVCHSFAPTKSPSVSPTKSPTTVPFAIMNGDPFTSYNGKTTQFYMPLQVDTRLMTCGDFELFGRAMPSGVLGDSQQWFERVEVRSGDRQLVGVEVRDAARAVPDSAATLFSDNKESTDIAVTPAKRVASALDRLRKEQAEKSALTTLSVTVNGEEAKSTGWLRAAALNVTVAQDAARIGLGYVETVDVDSDDIAMQVRSSVAGKFASEADRVRKMHLDVKFTDLNATACAGVLPEIWGVRPMSRSTAQYLVPPKVQ
jgi:hypothetical protein